jgi:uncharacterized protein (TIGR00251 family)
MIALIDHAEGIVIPVRAQPGARRNEVVGEWNGALKVAVTAPPDAGRANTAIREVLAAYFGLKKSQVDLASGAASRDKKVLLRGIIRADVEKTMHQATSSQAGR